MKYNRVLIISTIIVTILLLMTACKSNETDTESCSTDDNSTNNIETTSELIIDENSRKAVIRDNSYDPVKEDGNIFTIHISNEYKEKAKLMQEIESSPYLEKMEHVYFGNCNIIVKDLSVVRKEWLDYSEINYKSMFNADGYVDIPICIYSYEGCDETLLTATQIWSGFEASLEDYRGKLSLMLEKGDSIDLRYTRPGQSITTFDDDSSLIQTVTLDRVSMDTPWWCNMVNESSEAMLIVPYEVITNMYGEDSVTTYVIKENNCEHKLRDYLEEICAEDKNKMDSYGNALINI
ncbi:MAG: hypothetical protein ACI4DS_01665, partial [Eubacterium sp.]